MFTLLRFPRSAEAYQASAGDDATATQRNAFGVGFERLRDRLHAHIIRALTPTADWLGRHGLSPNVVTVAGLVVNVVAAGFIVRGQLITAGALWLLAGALDLLDGTTARHTQTATPFGAFLDSTCDRLSEGVVFAAIVYHFAALGAGLYAALTTLVLLCSLMISYIRARAEAAGAQCRVGLATRAERVVLIAIGLCFGSLPAVIWILFAMTTLTVGQRVWHTYSQLAERASP